MSSSTDTQAALDTLKIIFKDKPNLLEIVTPSDLESKEWVEKLRSDSGIFASPIKLYGVGRTGAGKTSIGNVFFGQEVMRSTGHMDCTDYVGLLKLKGNLWYLDTPGGGNNEAYENITRAALLLDQLPDDTVDTFEMHDFTMATGKDQGVEKRQVTVEEWATLYKKFFSPDVILFTVAPHMLFLRGDREYVAALLRTYADKIVFALNIWFKDGIQVTTDANITDAKEHITKVYQRLFPGQKAEPTFVVIHALTGAGTDELTGEICALIPPEKLGKMHAALKEELKSIADKEQNRRFQQALHLIAARLALYTVDQQIGDENLMSIAASGIIQYAVKTFKDATELLAIQDDLYAIAEHRVGEIKKERSEDIKQKVYETERRAIEVQKPRIREEIVEHDIPYHEPITSVKEIEKGTLERAAISFEGLLKKVGSFFENWDTSGFQNIDKQTADRMVEKRTDVHFEERTKRVEVLQHRVDGYETEIAGYVNEIISVKDVVVGQKSLTGGFPLIEFLVGLGLGVKYACQDTTAQVQTNFQSHIANAIKTTQARLLSCKPRLEAFIKQGGTAEQEIVALLDQQLIDN
jgi:hypothetical protein